MANRSCDDDIDNLIENIAKKFKKQIHEDMAKRNKNVRPMDVVDTQLEDKDDDVISLPSTSNGAGVRNEPRAAPKSSNIKKDILNILPKCHLDETEEKLGGDITAELGDSWRHLLANGLDMPDKKALEAKYPVPNNCQVINAPEINALVKNELQEERTLIRKDVEIQNKQKQIAMSITCISNALTKLIDRDGDRDIIQILVDAGKLLCDFQYQESTARRNAIAMKFNKDLRALLLETKVDSFLFGEKWNKNLLKQFEDATLKKQMNLQTQSNLLYQSIMNNPQVDLD